MIQPDVRIYSRPRCQSPFRAREQDTCAQMAKNTFDTTNFKGSKASAPQFQGQFEPLSVLLNEVSNARIMSNPPPKAF